MCGGVLRIQLKHIRDGGCVIALGTFAPMMVAQAGTTIPIPRPRVGKGGMGRWSVDGKGGGGPGGGGSGGGPGGC